MQVPDRNFLSTASSRIPIGQRGSDTSPWNNRRRPVFTSLLSPAPAAHSPPLALTAIIRGISRKSKVDNLWHTTSNSESGEIHQRLLCDTQTKTNTSSKATAIHHRARSSAALRHLGPANKGQQPNRRSSLRKRAQDHLNGNPHQKRASRRKLA